MDREKVIKGLECHHVDELNRINCADCPYYKEDDIAMDCLNSMHDDALALLKEQEAKPIVHIHEEYPEHDWERDKNGDIEDFAYFRDYHNGPMCKRCYYAFCIHCDPDGWNKAPCIIDKYKCPKCGRYIIRHIKFCSDCGQELKWE